MKFDITSEEILSLNRYLEGEDDSVVGTQTIVSFLGMSWALQRKLVDDLRAAGKENARLSRKIERLELQKSSRIARGEFAQLDFDSLEIASATLEYLKSRTRDCTPRKVDYMVFDVYANWLYTHSERLFPEAPVAQEWGPCFWRVFSKLDVRADSRGSFSSVAGKNPGVAALIKNVVGSYYSMDEAELKRRLTGIEPYRNAHKSNNGGKWNKVLSDSDIWCWMDSRYRR